MFGNVKRVADDIYAASGVLRTLQLIFFGAAILYFGKPLLIPFSFALLISFVLYPICSWLEHRSLGRMTAILTCISLLCLLMASLGLLLVQQLFSFIREWPEMRVKLAEASSEVSTYLLNNFNISRELQAIWLDDLLHSSRGDLLNFLMRAVEAYSYTTVLLFLIPIISALILYYRHRMIKVLYLFFPIEHRVGIRSILTSTISAYYNFIKGMAIVYFVVGTLNTIGLLLLGIPHAVFFGYTVAVLTFIPYVGIIVGSLLPISMAWLTYNSVWYPVGVVLIFAFVQYLEANIIFPLAVSNRLKINALATIVSILVGGLFWGVAGMILFVPFLAIIKLIADHSPRLKTWSTLLGTGNLPT